MPDSFELLRSSGNLQPRHALPPAPLPAKAAADADVLLALLLAGARGEHRRSKNNPCHVPLALADLIRNTLVRLLAKNRPIPEAERLHQWIPGQGEPAPRTLAAMAADPAQSYRFLVAVEGLADVCLARMAELPDERLSPLLLDRNLYGLSLREDGRSVACLLGLRHGRALKGKRLLANREVFAGQAAAAMDASADPGFRRAAIRNLVAVKVLPGKAGSVSAIFFLAEMGMDFSPWEDSPGEFWMARVKREPDAPAWWPAFHSPLDSVLSGMLSNPPKDPASVPALRFLRANPRFLSSPLGGEGRIVAHLAIVSDPEFVLKRGRADGFLEAPLDANGRSVLGMLARCSPYPIPREALMANAGNCLAEAAGSRGRRPMDVSDVELMSRMAGGTPAIRLYLDSLGEFMRPEQRPEVRARCRELLAGALPLLLSPELNRAYAKSWPPEMPPSEAPLLDAFLFAGLGALSYQCAFSRHREEARELLPLLGAVVSLADPNARVRCLDLTYVRMPVRGQGETAPLWEVVTCLVPDEVLPEWISMQEDCGTLDEMRRSFLGEPGTGRETEGRGFPENARRLVDARMDALRARAAMTPSADPGAPGPFL